MPLTAVVSSPLERTRETADPVAADHGLDVIVDPSFIEFDTGEWTGRMFAYLAVNDLWRRFNAVRSLTRIPGGELMIEVQHRAVTRLLALRQQFPSGAVMIVSHGDVLRSLLMYALGIPIDFYQRLDPSPARISIVDIADDSARVLQVNGDTATLIAGQ